MIVLKRIALSGSLIEYPTGAGAFSAMVSCGVWRGGLMTEEDIDEVNKHRRELCDQLGALQDNEGTTPFTYHRDFAAPPSSRSQAAQSHDKPCATRGPKG